MSIPMNKAIAGWDKAKQVELSVQGHFHQSLDGGRWIVNGCLVGYSAYALRIKASYTPPQQAFFLIDRDCGKTIVAPIILVRDR